MKNNIAKLTMLTLFFKNTLKKLVPEHVKPYSFSLFKWTLIGYLIRVAVAPLFASTDFVVLLWRSFIFAKTYKLVPMGDPPLISCILGPLLITVLSFLSMHAFDDLTSNIRYNPFVASIPVRMSCEGMRVLLFIVKMPYLIMDLALAFLLLRLIDDNKKSVLAFKLWCINPIAIFISFIIGQYDIFPVFFTLLSLYFLKVKRLSLSVASLGIASAFKWFPLLIFFPAIVIYSKQQPLMKEKILSLMKFCIIGLTPILLSTIYTLVAPYYESINAAYMSFEYYNGFFGSRVFIPWYNISSPLLANLFIFGIDFSSELQLFQSVTIYIWIVVYGIFFFACIFYIKGEYISFGKAILVLFLMYYAFSHFHSQWFLWSQPFLIMLIIENKKYFKLFPLFTFFYFIYNFYWDSSLTSALLVPITIQAWTWPGPIGILESLGLPGVQILNIFRSLFSALCIFTSVLALNNIICKSFNNFEQNTS